MSFQNLRPGSAFYIFYKDAKPRVEVGQVVSVTQPVPKYPAINNLPYNTGNQEMVLDAQVRVGEAPPVNYQKLPTNFDTVDLGNNSIVTCSKDALMAEINGFRQFSADALAKIDFHKSVVAGCDEILVALNPEIAERQRMEEENRALRSEVAEIKSMMAKILGSLEG